MKLKNLTKDNENLFDHIIYFKKKSITTIYWKELIIEYGNRELLPTVEEIFLEEGLQGVGDLFSAKSISIWNDMYNCSEQIKEDVQKNKITISSNKEKSEIAKQNNHKTEQDRQEQVETWDNIKTDTDSSNHVDNTVSSENIDTVGNGERTTEEQGFIKDKINQLYRVINKYPDVRKEIYKDIVNTLCLQIY